MGNHGVGPFGLLVVVMSAAVMVIPMGSVYSLTGDAAAEPTEYVLRLGFMQPVDSLNPYVGLNDVSYIFYSLVYDSLTGVGGDMKPAPGLATSWCAVPLTDPEMIGNGYPYGSVWEYNLTQNANWTDGVPFTADDVVYNVNLNAWNYDFMWAYQPYSYFMKEAKKVDDYTVRIYFWNRVTGDPTPAAYGDQISIPILPKHKLENMAPEDIGFIWTGIFPEEEVPIVGTGPFTATPDIYDEWLMGDHLTLVRRSNYHMTSDYGMLVHFDKILFRFYEDYTSLSYALRYGEIDFASLPPQAYRNIQSDVNDGSLQNVVCYDGSNPTQYWTHVGICMNEAGPNLARLDYNVRQALAHATDKTYIVDNYYLGLADEGSTLIAPVNSDWHYELQPGEEFAFNMTYANYLLESSGYRDTNSDGIREVCADSMTAREGWELVGTPLSFEMLVRREFPEEKDIAAYLKAIWEQIGVRINYQVVDEAELSVRVYSYAYDTCIWYWSSDPDPNYQLFVESQHAWFGWSDNKYYNPYYDENYTASVQSLDRSARQQAVYNCQKIHYWDSPNIILAYTDQTVAWRNDTFVGWGDWAAEPGRSILSYYTGNPLYFDLFPIGASDLPPYDLSIVADPNPGCLNETVLLIASARDVDGGNISFYIEFDDNISSSKVTTGAPYELQTAAFSHVYSWIGDYLITVWADDMTGYNVSTSMVLSVDTRRQELTYRMYDMMEEPYWPFWDWRFAGYLTDQVLWNEPHKRVLAYSPTADGSQIILQTPYRWSVDARNVSTMNVHEPVFMPTFGPENVSGADASISIYSQYLYDEWWASYWWPTWHNSIDWIGNNTMNGQHADGWYLGSVYTVTMNRQAAEEWMNMPQSADPMTWWTENGDSNRWTFYDDWLYWISTQGNTPPYDIYCAYEGLYMDTGTMMDLTYDSGTGTVTLSIAHINWGWEVLSARWLSAMGVNKHEVYYDNVSIELDFTPTWADVSFDGTAQYNMKAVKQSGANGTDGAWAWQPCQIDFINSTAFHASRYNPWGANKYWSNNSGDPMLGQLVRYDSALQWLNLSEGQKLIIQLRTDNDVLGFMGLPVDPNAWDRLYNGDKSDFTALMVNGSMSLGYVSDARIANGYNPFTKTITLIGPMDFDGLRWANGALIEGAPYIEFNIGEPESVQGTVDYVWYDMFNVPFGDWWYRRMEVYPNLIPISNVYPFVFWDMDDSIGEWSTYSSMRMYVNGADMPEINMNSSPEFLPLFGSERGGSTMVWWYMQYLTTEEITTRYPSLLPLDDGWLVCLNGSVYMDRQASKSIMGIDDSQFDDFDNWWAANEISFENDYVIWLDNEGNHRLDIYSMYEYPFTQFYFDLMAEKYGEYIIMSYDTVSWGMECLMARWLREAFMPVDMYYEGLWLFAEIGPTSTNLTLDTAVPWALYAYETTVGAEPCWVWEPSLADYIPSSGAHPSDFDPYENKIRECRSPGSGSYGQMIPYDYTPHAFNLSAGETLTFLWPAGSQLFVEHIGPNFPGNVTGGMTVEYGEPWITDMPINMFVDPVSRIVSFTGPIDFWSWSKYQTEHDFLESEWTRLGVLPRGTPWLEFSMTTIENAPPVAVIDVTPSSGTISTVFTFDASASYDAEDNVSELWARWDWEGDGEWDDEAPATQVMTHQYNAVGNYTIILTVVDTGGLNGTASSHVYVYNMAPIASFTVTPSVGNISTLFSSDASASSDLETPSSELEVRWDWEDDGVFDTLWTTSKLAAHCYSYPGTYTVVLEVRDSSGQVDNANRSITVVNTAPVPVLTVTPSSGNVTVVFSFNASGCYDLEDSWFVLEVRWDWESDGVWDLDWSSAKETTHQYATPGSYTVLLQVRDLDGLSANMTRVVNVVNEAPVAVLSITPDSGIITTEFTLNASGSTDLEDASDALSFRWDFESDGVWNIGWTTNKTVTHVFGVVGDYSVRLQVRDTLGGTDEATAQVSILNTPPNAVMTASSVTGNIETIFGFDASLSSDLEDTLAQLMVRWDYQDDGIWDVTWTTSKTAVHIYGVVGTYTVRLQVRDSMGLVDDDTEVITVVNTAPSASFTRTPLSGYITTVFQFDASGCTDFEDASAQLQVRWDFEDDGDWDVNWTTSKTTTHIFDLVGDYTVRLQARDTGGLTDDESLGVDVLNTAPTAAISATPMTTNATTAVQLDASGCTDLEDSQGVLRVRWDFDNDGTWDTSYSNTKTAQRIYTALGTATIRVEVMDSGGLTDTAQITITVTDDRPPVAQISVAGTSGQNGWLVSAATITLSATDDASGVASISYRVDGGTWTTYLSLFAVSSNGMHTVECRATDAYGNTGAIRSAQVKIDTAVPVAAHAISGALGNAGWYTSSVSVTLGGTDSESGIESLMYRVDGASWLTYVSAIPIGADGEHTLEYYARDLAGNAGTTQSVSLEIDKVAPTSAITVSGSLGEQGWRVGAVSLTIASSDSGSGLASVWYRIDGGSWTEYEGPVSLSATGTYVVEYHAVDVAGNEGAAGSETVKIDRDLPVISATNADAVAKVTSSTVNITWTATDVGSGVSEVLVFLDDDTTPITADGSYIVLEGLSDGDHEIRLVVADNAGNTAEDTVQVNVNTSVFSLDGPAGPWVVTGLIVLVLAIIAVLVVMMLRRRRAGEGGAGTGGAGEGEAGAPPAQPQ